MIKKHDDKYILYSQRTHKELGTFNTRKEAEDREKEINMIKNIAINKVKENKEKKKHKE